MAIIDANNKAHSEANGRFVSKSASELKAELAQEIPNKDSLVERKVMPSERIVEVNLDAEIQRQFDKATPKERSKIAFHYVMDNLRGKYPTKDNREVFVERVGAKEMTHTLYEPKIRVIPELGKLIRAGEFIKISMAEHGQFKEFAYYKVDIKIANDTYSAVLNIGIRDNGDSTLYDINQFKRI